MGRFGIVVSFGHRFLPSFRPTQGRRRGATALAELIPDDLESSSSQSFSQSLGPTAAGGSVLARQTRNATTTADRARSISLTGVTGTRVRIRVPPPQSLQTLGPSCGPIQPGGRDKR